MSSFPECELKVEEGSPYGGVECADSPAELPEAAENLYPFDNLAVEFYEDPDESASKNEQQGAEMNTSVESTSEMPSIHDFCATELQEMDDSAIENVPANTTDYNNDSAVAEALDSSTYATEEEEPNYQEIQKSYFEDFMCSNTSSFDEGSNSLMSNGDDGREEQKGSPLSRFPKIVRAVEIADYESIQVLFQLIYQRSAWDTQEILTQGILSFSGFNFSPNSEDYTNRIMMLQTLPNEVLIKIGAVLGLDQIHKMLQNPDKERPSLIEAIMHFLFKPSKKTRTTGGVEDPSLISNHLPSKCGCRNRCFRKFTKIEQKRLIEYMQELKEKNLFDKYLFTLIELRKIVRGNNEAFKEDSRKFKEVFYLYKCKFDDKEVIVCKGAFMALHGVKMGKMNTLQVKLKTGKRPKTDGLQFPSIINEEFKALRLKDEETLKAKKSAKPVIAPTKPMQPTPPTKKFLSQGFCGRGLEQPIRWAAYPPTPLALVERLSSSRVYSGVLYSSAHLTH